MKHLVWGVLLICMLISGTSFGNSFTSFGLGPNDGSGENFAFFQQENGSTIFIVGGAPFYYFNINGYRPGSTVLGDAPIFFSGGTLTIHGRIHDFEAADIGNLFVSSLTLPTNGASTFSALVTGNFSIDVTDLNTDQTFNVSGSGKGKITFHLFDGLYYGDTVTFTSGSTVPEPGTFGLIASGLIGILGVAKRKLRISRTAK